MNEEQDQIVKNLLKLTTLPYTLINKNKFNVFNTLNIDVESFGFPLWIRTLNNSFCGVAPESYDVPLLLKKAVLKSNSDNVLIQKAVKGKTFYVLAKKYRQRFIPTEIFSVKFLSGIYRVPYIYWTPPSISQEQVDILSQTIDKISTHIPHTLSKVFIEFIKTKTKFNIAFISNYEELDISLTELQKIKAKNIKEKHHTLLLHWLIPGGGMVEKIIGLDFVNKIKNILKIHITLQPGDTIKHISDIPSRNKTGFIITKGINFSQAYSSGKRIIKAIKIKTSNLIC